MKKVKSPEIYSIGFDTKLRFINKIFNKLYVLTISLIGPLWYCRSKSINSININWSSVLYNRVSLVNMILRKFENPKYLEIGCAGNYLFNSVPARFKIGVDPLAGGTHRMTSDAFFEKNDIVFDVIFIDGLHTYEQVYLDVQNSLESLHINGYILLHDLIPLSWIEQHVPNISKDVWTGDVWRIIFDLLVSKGINFFIVEIDHGVGVIQKLDNSSILVKSEESSRYSYDDLVDAYSNLPIIKWDEVYSL